MNVFCRPITLIDFGIVECAHWESSEQVHKYIEAQGIASMLAFDGERYLGQLYLQEYDPGFCEPGGWVGERPWADFRVAEPLGLKGRFLTLGCFHVGWMPDNTKHDALYGHGIGSALLWAVVEWFRGQRIFDGLLTWALVPGSHSLLQMAGQMPYTVYERFGFRLVKEVQDPRGDNCVSPEMFPGFTEDPTVLRVMVLGKNE